VCSNIASQFAAFHRSDKKTALPTFSELTGEIQSQSSYHNAYHVLLSHMMTTGGDDLGSDAQTCLNAFESVYCIEELDVEVEHLIAFVSAFDPTNNERMHDIADCVETLICIASDTKVGSVNHFSPYLP
jgi:hypothetical protein